MRKTERSIQRLTSEITRARKYNRKLKLSGLRERYKEYFSSVNLTQRSEIMAIARSDKCSVLRVCGRDKYLGFCVRVR